jgi:hypothetical protein
MLPEASSLRASLAVLSGSFLVWGILRSLDDILVALFNASPPANCGRQQGRRMGELVFP